MSGVLRGLGQLAVGAIGYALGGPLGFAAANLAFSLIVGPPRNNDVRRFGDTNLEGSQVGIPIPRFYGQMNKVRGNVISCGKNNKGEQAGILVKVKKEKVGKKGGKSQSQKVEVGYLTAAYLIGEGPLYIDRIVADTRDGEKTIYNRYGKTHKKRGGTFTPEFAPDGTLISELSPKLRLYFGTEYQQPDSALQAFYPRQTAFRGVAYVVFNQYKLGQDQPSFHFYVRSPITNRSEIIHLRLREAGVPESRIEIKNIWGRVNGAWVTARESARTLCEAMARQCFTDFVFPGDAIKDVSKCHPRIVSIDKSQMGAALGGAEDVDAATDAATIEMKGEEEFISDYSIPFNDINLNYDDNSAHAIRYSKNQVTTLANPLPISATLEEVLPFAQIEQNALWTEDRNISIPLMPGNIDISPGEVVNVPDLKFPLTSTPITASSYYITEQSVTPEGIVNLRGVPYDRNVFHPLRNDAHYPAKEPPVVREPEPVPQIDPPLTMIVDAPVSDAAALRTGIIYMACAPLDTDGSKTYWAGAQFAPETSEFPVAELYDESSLGVTLNSYENNPEENMRINFDRKLRVRMHYGVPATASLDAVLNEGANMIAINNGDPARTLLMQYVTATKLNANDYELSGLLPGRYGTDYVATRGVPFRGEIPTGARVALVTNEEGNLVTSALPIEGHPHYVGRTITYRSYSDEEEFTDEKSFVFRANSQVPLSPTYFRIIEREDGNAWTFGWCARTRFQAGAVWTLTRASDPDNYIIRIKRGELVMKTYRVENATMLRVTRSDLLNVAGVGWPGGVLPAQIEGTISQISDAVGEGHPHRFNVKL